MTDTRIAQRAHKLVLDHLCVDGDQIVTDAKFVDDLGADSLDSVEMCMAVEEEFGVEMDDDSCDRVFNHGTFGDLLGWLDQQQIVA